MIIPRPLDVLRPQLASPTAILPLVADLGYLCELAPDSMALMGAWLFLLPPPHKWLRELGRELSELAGLVHNGGLDDDTVLERIESVSLAVAFARRMALPPPQWEHWHLDEGSAQLAKRLHEQDLTRLAGRAQEARVRGLSALLPWRCVPTGTPVLRAPTTRRQSEVLARDWADGRLLPAQTKVMVQAMEDGRDEWLAFADLCRTAVPQGALHSAFKGIAVSQRVTGDRQLVLDASWKPFQKWPDEPRMRRVQPAPAVREPRADTGTLSLLALRADLAASTALTVLAHPESPLSPALLRLARVFGDAAGRPPEPEALLQHRPQLEVFVAASLQRARGRLAVVAQRSGDLALQVALDEADAALTAWSGQVRAAALLGLPLVHDARLAELEAWWATANLEGRPTLLSPWPDFEEPACIELPESFQATEK